MGHDSSTGLGLAGFEEEQEPCRARTGVGRPPPRRAARAAHEGGRRQAGDRRPLPGLRRRRRPAGRAQPAGLIEPAHLRAQVVLLEPGAQQRPDRRLVVRQRLRADLAHLGLRERPGGERRDRLGRVALPRAPRARSRTRSSPRLARRRDEADLADHELVLEADDEWKPKRWSPCRRKSPTPSRVSGSG